MAQTPRRAGAKTSNTRDVLLDCVEALMLEKGYAAVTFRNVAAKAGVAPSLVQYYFQTLDGIFIAAIRRYSERNLTHLADALRERADQPFRVLWEYSWEEATGALMTEFTALGNHRKSIRKEIAEVTEQVRKIQLHAVTAKFGNRKLEDERVTPVGLLLLVTGIPKFLNLEKGVGVSTGHRDLINAFESYLESVEPVAKNARRASKRRVK